MVLFLGRMQPAKGVFDLLEAIAALRPAVPDVRLVCAGDGDRIAVASYAESLGIADAVKFTGWVGPAGKRALFEAAAAFALPSYEEALPAGLLEAMGAGVPPVASAVGGIPEVVVDGVSGFLVAPGDRSSLERALRRLLIDTKLAARIGAAARETVRLRFAPERALPQLEEIYAALGVHALGAEPAAPVGARAA
jgi:glycosyltransferase involved in cell wall biosynthesis